MANRWLILIEENEIVACLVKGSGSLFVSKLKEWGGNEKDDLVAVLDSALGECLSSSGDDQGPKETIFILSPYWVSDSGEVLETRKQILKEICQSLSLSPLGFLVGDEALAQYFTDFVSVYFGKDQFRISLIKSGRVKRREQLDSSVGLDIEALEIMLKKIEEEGPLPDEIIFWGQISEEGKKKIASYWKGKEKIFSWIDLFDHLFKVISGEETSSEEAKMLIPKEEIFEKKETEESDDPEDKKEEVNFGFTTEDVAISLDEISEEKSDEKDLADGEGELEQLEKEIEKDIEEERDEGLGSKGEKRKGFSFPKFSFDLSFLKSITSTKAKYLLFATPAILLIIPVLTWYLSKVAIDIYITPETIEKQLDVELDPEADKLDSAKGIIPAEQVEITVSGQQSRATTGDKLVGDEAKGEVTIYNRTSDVLILEQGTSLIGPGDLKFSLDSEVTVASKTPDLVSGVDRWGEVKVNVTADGIGAEYNLAADSSFTVDSYSGNDLLAKNGSEFSGGTSRKIRAVSEEDKEELKGTLLEELSTEAKEKMESQSSGEVLRESLQTEVTKADYNAEVGDEEESLNLEMEVKAKAIKLSKERMDQLAMEVIKKDLSDDLVLDLDTIKVDFDLDEVTKEGVVVGTLSLNGKVYPQIDTSGIISQLVGKNQATAQQVIRAFPRVYRYQLNYKPSIIKFLRRLPPRREGISIEIKE